MKLVLGLAVQHAEDFENVAVAVVSVEFVSGAVEAEDELPRFPAMVYRRISPWDVSGRRLWLWVMAPRLRRVWIEMSLVHCCFRECSVRTTVLN
jgi:hypothetical protein